MGAVEYGQGARRRRWQRLRPEHGAGQQGREPPPTTLYTCKIQFNKTEFVGPISFSPRMDSWPMRRTRRTPPPPGHGARSIGGDDVLVRLLRPSRRMDRPPLAPVVGKAAAGEVEAALSLVPCPAARTGLLLRRWSARSRRRFLSSPAPSLSPP
ncbi:hypothetical protein BRADI_3g22799v3 [Brachypodium distachyon]|uniref:Uncharacterized protein n=1 Tax=Brachypodium distachyon TaxID=15368 RepID=A0A2K2CYW4_BRADI|nr:hypothetical protein BRADI_3g22799v3 [Brachypodium distachyon]